MTKVRYEGTGLRSKGIHFTQGVYTVKDEVAEYLVKTFPTWFKKVEEPKPVEKAKPKPKQKPKAETE
jgi:hypothetical protein